MKGDGQIIIDRLLSFDPGGFQMLDPGGIRSTMPVCARELPPLEIGLIVLASLQGLTTTTGKGAPKTPFAVLSLSSSLGSFQAASSCRTGNSAPAGRLMKRIVIHTRSNVFQLPNVQGLCTTLNIWPSKASAGMASFMWFSVSLRSDTDAVASIARRDTAILALGVAGNDSA